MNNRMLVGMGVVFGLGSSQLMAATPSPDQIAVYASPHAAKAQRYLPANTNLVTIYREGGWLKVGNPANGNVGWVKLQQVQQAQDAFYRPDIQTIYVQHTETTAGKPQWVVVAYKNGHRLSDAQAMHLYKAMQRSQRQQQREMHQFARWMSAPMVDVQPMLDMHPLLTTVMPDLKAPAPKDGAKSAPDDQSAAPKDNAKPAPSKDKPAPKQAHSSWW